TVLQNMGSATVSPTAVFDLHIRNLVSHDVFTTVSDQNISVSVTNDAGDFFGAGTFNGPSLHFLASSHLITNISLDPATNVQGFDLSRVSVVPDGSGGQFVDINVQGFTFPTNNWLISLGVQSVPEPSSLALTTAAIAASALLFFKRRRDP